MLSTNSCTLNPPSFLERFTSHATKKDTEEALFPPPPLTPPAQLPSSSEYRLLNAIQSLTGIKEDLSRVQKNKLEAFRSRLDDATHLHLEQLKENAEALQSNHFWSFLKKVATSVLAALSLITGFTLATTAATATAGGALIVSGILSIAHIVLSESKGWDWITECMQIENDQTREAVRKYLPIACGILAAGCALLGSVEAVGTTVFHFSEKAAAIAQATFTLFMTTSQVGKGLSDANLQFTQAKLQTSEKELEVTNTQFDLLTQSFQTLLSYFDYTFKSAKRAMQSIVQTHHFY